MENIIILGDCIEEMKKLPEKSINMCITSPPYWALRNYGDNTSTIWDGDPNCNHEFELQERYLHRGTTKSTVQASVDKKGGIPTEWRVEDGICRKCGAWKGQLGLEPDFNLYIKHLADIFDEVKRVLRDDGTLWVNLGDTYNGAPVSGKQGGFQGDITRDNPCISNVKKPKTNIPAKSLIGIPFRFAIEMINRGWILRNTIIWHKRNCMPSSAKDRFTVDFEYIFFFSKKKQYYFKQQLETIAKSSLKDPRLDNGREEHIGKSAMGIYGCNATTINSKGRNKRCVWTINPKLFKESHFAVYPEELCETPIKAGCPKYICKKCGKPKISIKPTCNCNAGFTSGIVLDPFFGSGTTGIVALKQGKRFIGIELNPEYIEIAKARIKPFLEQEKL